MGTLSKEKRAQRQPAAPPAETRKLRASIIRRIDAYVANDWHD